MKVGGGWRVRDRVRGDGEGGGRRVGLEVARVEGQGLHTALGIICLEYRGPPCRVR